MPWTKHPRHMTNQQFSASTTVDGSRIDEGLDQMVDHMNRLPRGDIETRFVPQTFVLGWSPQEAASTFTSPFPWMVALNDEDSIATNSTTPRDFSNFQRLKGYAAEGINPFRPASAVAGKLNGQQWIWTTSVSFKQAVVVDSIYFAMTVDSAVAPLTPYNADWLWGGALNQQDCPVGISPGYPANDLVLALHVDHVYKPEDRALNSVDVMRRDFPVPVHALRNYTGAPANDMTPAYPGGELTGHYTSLKINTPLPELSRVRFSVCIPDFTDSAFGGAASDPWGTYPMFRQCFHLVMVVLEEIQ